MRPTTASVSQRTPASRGCPSTRGHLAEEIAIRDVVQDRLAFIDRETSCPAGRQPISNEKPGRKIGLRKINAARALSAASSPTPRSPGRPGPPGAALIAWATIGEAMPPLAWLGMGLAAIGVALVGRPAPRTRRS
jgi:hypothetical protein